MGGSFSLWRTHQGGVEKAPRRHQGAILIKGGMKMNWPKQAAHFALTLGEVDGEQLEIVPVGSRQRQAPSRVQHGGSSSATTFRLDIVLAHVAKAIITGSQYSCAVGRADAREDRRGRGEGRGKRTTQTARSGLFARAP